MGWVSVSCMTCLGSETVFLYLVAGKQAQYAHIASKNALSEAGIDKVLKCLTCPVSSFLMAPRICRGFSGSQFNNLKLPSEVVNASPMSRLLKFSS